MRCNKINEQRFSDVRIDLHMSEDILFNRKIKRESNSDHRTNRSIRFLSSRTHSDRTFWIKKRLELTRAHTHTEWNKTRSRITIAREFVLWLWWSTKQKYTQSNRKHTTRRTNRTRGWSLKTRTQCNRNRLLSNQWLVRCCWESCSRFFSWMKLIKLDFCTVPMGSLNSQ